MKILKTLGLVVVALALVLALAAFYLLGSGPVPETTNYVIDLPELRARASSIPGEKPTSVRFEVVASGRLPRAMLMAGEGFEPVEMPRPVFQLRYPDGSFLLIDAAYDRSLHEAGAPEEPYDDDAWANLVAAMDEADRIVITHEHSDHIGGVAKYPRPLALAKNLILNPEQISSRGRVFTELPEDLIEAIDPLRYSGAIAVAPGVVLRRAAGHTPGSQMVFVTLGDGRELLFVGDVVWNLDAVTELKYRPRLVTDLVLGEDRDAVLDQIRALRDVHDAGEVALVVSHDARTYSGAGFEEGFVLSSD